MWINSQISQPVLHSDVPRLLFLVSQQISIFFLYQTRKFPQKRILLSWPLLIVMSHFIQQQVARILWAVTYFYNGVRHFNTLNMHEQGWTIPSHMCRFPGSFTVINNYSPSENCSHNFDCKTRDQDKPWDLHICCIPYFNRLTAWFDSK